jgi:hypothetical protein
MKVVIRGQVGQVAWPRGKESSHVEAEKEKAKQDEYQQNDKCATYSGAKPQ